MSPTSRLQMLAATVLTPKCWASLLAVFVLAGGVVPQGVQGQSFLFREPFDDESQFSVTRGTTDQDRDDNYFILAQDADPPIDQSYSNSGTNFLAGQDTDDPDVANGADDPQITWSGIDISGEGGLQFTGRFGANGSDYENDDFLRVEYRIDGGAWKNLIAFRGDTNADLSEDTDFDGTGDGTAINDGSLSSFSKDIGGTASTLDLRFTAQMSAGGEDFAVDDFQIESTTAVQFTASSGAVGESEGSTALTIQISEPSGSGDEDVTLEFDAGNSDATQSDFTSTFPGTNTTKTVTFSSASDGDTEAVTLSFADDGNEGVETARFNLTSPSSGLELHPSTQFDLTVEDAVSDHGGDVMIVEYMPNPSAVNDSEGEYVELYNATSSSKNIDGWDIDGDAISGVTIPARGFAVICRNSDAASNGGIQNCDDQISLALGNGSDTIVLSNSSGTETDRVDYDDTSWPDPDGASVIFTGTTDNNVSDNWETATRRELGYAQNQSGDDGSPGRNGTGQTLQPTTEITGPAEWRMLSAPMGGVNADMLAQVSLVQGVDGHLPSATPNLSQWPGGTDNNVDWTVPSSATTDLTSSAQGYIWYVFGAAETAFTDTPPFTLGLPGSPRTSDVTTNSLSGVSSGNNAFHLLGNPYAQSFDLSGLNLSGQDFQTTVQVWDPSAGTYNPVTQSSASEDLIGPYQGFFVERATTGSAALTFSASGRRADPVDLKTMEEVPPRIEFHLVGRDGEGSVRTRDEALVLHAPDGGTSGWDVYDASKLTPLSDRYATAAFRDTLGGTLRLQSVASIPPTLPDEGIELPVSLQLQGTDPVETFRLRWPTWKNVPDNWGIALYDATTDSIINLRTQSSYAFPPSAPKGQSAPPPASPMERPAQIRAKAGSDSTRFMLLVQPNSIPVELAGFDATVSGTEAQLTWVTASETNNAGFHVEHHGPDAERFTSVGFVEGHGTTDRPKHYRFRIGPLDPGPHVFRLRQVDVDGAATRSDTVAVQVRLTEAAEVTVTPNPVHTRATVSLRVRAEQAVRVGLYDVLGRRVRTVHTGSMAPGRAHTFRVNASTLSSGLYLLRADGEQFQKTRRVTVVR